MHVGEPVQDQVEALEANLNTTLLNLIETTAVHLEAKLDGVVRRVDQQVAEISGVVNELMTGFSNGNAQADCGAGVGVGSSTVGSSVSSAAVAPVGVKDTSATLAQRVAGAISGCSSSAESTALGLTGLRRELGDMQRQFQSLQSSVDTDVLEAFRRLRHQTGDLSAKVDKLAQCQKSSSATDTDHIRETVAAAGGVLATMQATEAVNTANAAAAKAEQAAVVASEAAVATEANANKKLGAAEARLGSLVEARCAELAKQQASHHGQAEEHVRALDVRFAEMGRELLLFMEERFGALDGEVKQLRVQASSGAADGEVAQAAEAGAVNRQSGVSRPSADTGSSTGKIDWECRLSDIEVRVSHLHGVLFPSQSQDANLTIQLEAQAAAMSADATRTATAEQQPQESADNTLLATLDVTRATQAIQAQPATYIKMKPQKQVSSNSSVRATLGASTSQVAVLAGVAAALAAAAVPDAQPASSSLIAASQRRGRQLYPQMAVPLPDVDVDALPLQRSPARRPFRRALSENDTSTLVAVPPVAASSGTCSSGSGVAIAPKSHTEARLETRMATATGSGKLGKRGSVAPSSTSLSRGGSCASAASIGTPTQNHERHIRVSRGGGRSPPSESVQNLDISCGSSLTSPTSPVALASPGTPSAAPVTATPPAAAHASVIDVDSSRVSIDCSPSGMIKAAVDSLTRSNSQNSVGTATPPPPSRALQERRRSSTSYVPGNISPAIRARVEALGGGQKDVASSVARAT